MFLLFELALIVSYGNDQYTFPFTLYIAQLVLSMYPFMFNNLYY